MVYWKDSTMLNQGDPHIKGHGLFTYWYTVPTFSINISSIKRDKECVQICRKFYIQVKKAW